jgi:hypothetical protein
MINVPHAFTPEYPADETSSKPCKVPVILNVHDAYMAGTNSHDLAIDVEGAFGRICEMSYCHQSQISEWLPWVVRHNLQAPRSLADWQRTMKKRFLVRNRELGIPSRRALEVFTVTAWGIVPDLHKLVKDFPNLVPEASNLERLKQRLKRWRGELD